MDVGGLNMTWDAVHRFHPTKAPPLLLDAPVPE